jgi:hypothetical protein
LFIWCDDGYIKTTLLMQEDAFSNDYYC